MDILTNAVKETIIIGKPHPEKKAFCIALSGTDNYIPYLGLTMMSVYQYNKQLPMAFHLFVNGLPDTDRKRLCEAAEMMGNPIYVHLMNDTAFQSLVFGEKTAVFFYRFVLANLLEAESDRVLYLDGDIMCCGSLQKLADMDLGQAIAAVAPDRLQKKQMRQIGTTGFFNAGAMLIHISEWVRQDIFHKVVDMAHDSLTKIDDKGYYEGWHGLKYNDQNILNVILDGKVIWLPKKYNYIYKLNRSALFRKKAENEDYHDQIILHFAGSVKPWHDWAANWPVVKEYRKIWLDSPWEDVPPSAPKSRKDCHQAAREYRVTGQYGKALHWYLEYCKRKL